MTLAMGYWSVLGFFMFGLFVMLIAYKMFPHDISIPEIIIGVTIQAIVTGCIFYFGMQANGQSNQIINGQVTSKTKDRVSCSHSYQCNPVRSCSGVGSKRTCITVYSTCYEHSYDIDWNIHSDVNDTYTVNRIDRRGLQEPLKWTNTKIGDPYSYKESYYNFIKGSPISLFNDTALQSPLELPYHNQLYGFTVNRVINFHSRYNPNVDRLNDILNERIKTLGKEKKVNLSVIFHSSGQDFVDAFKAKNYGGEINDVTVLINADEKGVVQSVNVFSYSKSDLVNTTIRDWIYDLNTLNSDTLEQQADALTIPIKKYYEHRSMDEFAYLEDSKEMSLGWLIGMLAFGLLFPFVWAAIAQRVEIGR